MSHDHQVGILENQGFRTQLQNFGLPNPCMIMAGSGEHKSEKNLPDEWQGLRAILGAADNRG